LIRPEKEFFPLTATAQSISAWRRRYNAVWKFTRWDPVDLSRFKVKLKGELQGSNRDMYRTEAITATSEK
jgi:hypothetical protein